MNARPALIVLGVVLTLGLGLLVVACGGGKSGGNSLETYFESVKQSIDDADVEADEVEAGMDIGLAVADDLEGILDVLGDGLSGFQQLASDVRDDLEDIDVPEEIDELHTEFVAIFDAAAEALEAIGADLAEIDPSADEQDLLEQVQDFSKDLSEEFGSLGTESNSICFQLQEVADEHGIDVDLECGTTE